MGGRRNTDRTGTAGQSGVNAQSGKETVMENDNEFKKDPDIKTVDEILADIDRKAAISESLEESTDENDMLDKEVLSQKASYEDSTEDTESISEELSGADEVSDEQAAFEEESAEEYEVEDADDSDDDENSENNEDTPPGKKRNIFYRMAKSIIPWKGDNAGLIVRKIVFIVALIVFLVTAIPLLSDLLSMFNDQQVSNRISQMYQLDDTDVPEDNMDILPSFKKLLEINPDTVGYIRIDGTLVDYPVVKTTDNDFYLTHDFYKNESKSGTIMMDYHNKVTPQGHSGNLILYGHNMAVGTFFAPLNEYWRTMYDQYPEGTKSFYKEHPIIRFDTLYEQAEWKIFAFGIYNVDESRGEVYGYNLKYDFSSEDDFNDFMINIMDRSDIFTDVDLKYGDDILTLSTCCWPYEGSDRTVRLAVFARKIREGESKDVDVSKAEVNTYVRRWQWVYDKVSNGYDWFMSTWDRRKLLSYSADDAKRDGYSFPDKTE